MVFNTKKTTNKQLSHSETNCNTHILIVIIKQICKAESLIVTGEGTEYMLFMKKNLMKLFVYNLV